MKGGKAGNVRLSAIYGNLKVSRVVTDFCNITEGVGSCDSATAPTAVVRFNLM